VVGNACKRGSARDPGKHQLNISVRTFCSESQVTICQVPR
jgi:hypothetical protein